MTVSGFLWDHWLGLAYCWPGRSLAWRRHGPMLRLGATLCVIGLGGLLLPPEWGLWLFVVGLAVLVGLIAYLLITTNWYPVAGIAVAVLLAAGLGGWAAVPAGHTLVETARLLTSFEIVQPAWLLLMPLVPLVIAMSYRSLAGLGPVRRWVAIGLRSLVVVLLILALAELRLKKPGENVTVLFLVDRSLSIPQDIDPTMKESSLSTSATGGGCASSGSSTTPLPSVVRDASATKRA